MTQNHLAGPTPSAAVRGLSGWRLRRSRWLVAFTLLCLVLVGYLDRISIAILFTNVDFQRDMGTGFNPALFGMLMTAFFIPYGLSAIVLSFTGDRFGPRRMLIGASIIWGFLMFMMGGATSYMSLLLSRIALGAAEGPQFSWILRLISRWFSRAEYGRANMIWLAGSPLGSAVGFPVIIWLVAQFGWRNAFFVIGGLSTAIILPMLFLFASDGPAKVSAAEEKAGAIGVGALWRDSRLFLRNWDFWLLVAFDCGELFYLWGLNSWLPTYLQSVRHFSIQNLGFYTSLPFILLFIGVISSGVISDRLERKAPLLFVGLSAAAILLFVGTRASDASTAAMLIAASAGFFGLTIPTTYTVAQHIIPQGVISSGIGVLNGVANTFGALAPLLMGLVISATKTVEAGLLLLVCGTLICSAAILPIVRRY